MINQKQAKKFCKEDISLIENYDKASKDLLEVWDIHHRKEEFYSRQELIDSGMYYGRPASELIFLTRMEHISLHMKGNKYWLGKKHSEETRIKMSLNHADFKGEKGYWYGKTGEESYWYGKTGELHSRSKPIAQIDKKTCEVIKTWPCSMEVERVLGIGHGHISQCCSGKRKSCGGYIWRYV